VLRDRSPRPRPLRSKVVSGKDTETGAGCYAVLSCACQPVDEAHQPSGSVRGATHAVHAIALLYSNGQLVRVDCYASSAYMCSVNDGKATAFVVYGACRHPALLACARVTDVYPGIDDPKSTVSSLQKVAVSTTLPAFFKDLSKACAGYPEWRAAQRA
jgi:hypothetical protein